MLIIAEAGVNHNGEIALAKELIDKAKAAGADIVKFQTFQAGLLTSQFAQKAVYQQKETGSAESQLTMLKKLELTYGEFEELSRYAEKQDILFLSTPFDLESIEFLAGLKLSFWKIPSGEITNYPYLLRIAQTRKPVVLSTGMSTLDEIGEAIALLEREGTTDITLLHCNTQYPTPYGDVNLKAMETLHRYFGLPVGYSDHTQGIEIAIAAAAMGAIVIEKHFTLSRTLPGPDHKASLEPQEFAAMVDAIRNVESAMGDGVKRPSPSERDNIQIARKSIVAKRAILRGERFSEENITAKRPGNGLSPMLWMGTIGRMANRDFKRDELIEW